MAIAPRFKNVFKKVGGPVKQRQLLVTVAMLTLKKNVSMCFYTSSYYCILTTVLVGR